MSLRPMFFGAGGLVLLAACGSESALIVKPSAPPVIAHQVALVPVVDMSARLGQPVVYTMMQFAGIKRFSNGRCASRSNKSCTSYEGMRRGTVAGVIALKKASKCKIIVSGGTEKGHAKQKYSHENGWKADVMPTRCVDAYVHKHLRKVGERSDGSALYRAGSGPLYADEHGTHWDILFAPAWCLKRMIRHARCE
ncbi:MAG: hypothetical protein ABIS86_06915 [Streptosporangiaceae bacterium]